MIEPKYIRQVRKGDSVQYMQKMHTVQEWKGRLFIQFTDVDGKRKRLYIENHPDYLFDYGSEADYVFNEWWKVYPDFNIFSQFAKSELAWS